MVKTPTSDIVICMGSSCFSRGNKHTINLIKKYLKENEREQRVVFRGAHCTGICEKGPVLVLDGIKHTKVTPESVVSLLDNYFARK